MGGRIATARGIAAVVTLTVVAACSSPRQVRNDLEFNEQFYVATEYRARGGVDRAAYFAPMRDERRPVAEASGTASRRYVSDNSWERPPAIMCESILLAAFVEAGVFAEVLDEPRADALIVQPSLIAFNGGHEEMMSGRRAFAEVGLAVRIEGPADARGERAVVLEQVYPDVQVTEPMLRPLDPRPLIGRALRGAVARAVFGVDRSNVTRSQLFRADAARAPAAGDPPAGSDGGR